ncbi:MAG: hypothetical protein WBB31_19315 [Saprospiraceae bacterium]
MKKFLFFFSLFIFNNSMTAQKNDTITMHISPVSKYQAETIYLTFSGFVKNGKADDMGLSGGKLKKEMMISPDAVIVFTKFQHQRNWLFLLSGLELATSITALTAKNKSLKTGMLISGAALSVISIPLYIGSINNENRAVWLRNRDVLLIGNKQ